MGDGESDCDDGSDEEGHLPLPVRLIFTFPIRFHTDGLSDRPNASSSVGSRSSLVYSSLLGLSAPGSNCSGQKEESESVRCRDRGRLITDL